MAYIGFVVTRGDHIRYDYTDAEKRFFGVISKGRPTVFSRLTLDNDFYHYGRSAYLDLPSNGQKWFPLSCDPTIFINHQYPFDASLYHVILVIDGAWITPENCEIVYIVARGGYPAGFKTPIAEIKYGGMQLYKAEPDHAYWESNKIHSLDAEPVPREWWVAMRRCGSSHPGVLPGQVIPLQMPAYSLRHPGPRLGHFLDPSSLLDADNAPAWHVGGGDDQ